MRSLLRIAGATAAAVAMLLGGFALLVRQPVWHGLAWRGTIRSEPERLRRHVDHLARALAPRDVQHPENLERAAAYIHDQQVAAGAEVHDQIYRTSDLGTRDARNVKVRFVNVIARFGPATAQPLLVGAHYDAMGLFGDNPGADDNASGVAGLLELGRLLANRRLTRRVELVAFSTEEPPFFATRNMGSAVHARSLAADGVEPLGMICLEMIGFYTPRQPWPSALLRLLYPSRGDFIVIAGRWSDRALARHLKRGVLGAAHPAGVEVPAVSYNGPQIDGSDASDHRNYWAADVAAVLVTDTAFLRNPHYHSPADLPETLDYQRMAAVVDGVANAVLWAAGADEPQRTGSSAR